MDFKNYFDTKLVDELEVNGKVDELKFLALYMYYKYARGEKESINDEFLSSFLPLYSRKGGTNDCFIDAIIMNEEEDKEINIISSLYRNDEHQITDSELEKIFYRMQRKVNDVLKKNYYDKCNVEVEKRLMEIRDDSEDNLKDYKFKFIIINNSQPSEETIYELNNRIQNNFDKMSSSYELNVLFKEDILRDISLNSAPYQYVEKDRLIIKQFGNEKAAIHYNENGILCNVSAKCIKDLWKKYGGKGLLAMNLRYYVENTKIDDAITNSIRKRPDDFWYFNNGIIIVCDNFELKNGKVELTNFSIVNGGQTTKIIGTTPFEKDFYVMAKIIRKVKDGDEGQEFIANIAEASNSQKPIKAKDLIANRVEQRKLKSLLEDNLIYMEVKRGEKKPGPEFKEPWQKTKNNNLAQDLYSFAFLSPGPARNSVSSILNNNQKYDKLFKNHEYEPLFIKSLLFLEKSYEKYNNKVKKDKEFNADIKGLMKNGLYYYLATTGLILKFIYNDEFKNAIKENRDKKDLFEKFVYEQAFNFEFINLDWAHFKDKIQEFIFYIFNDIILKAYNEMKAKDLSLVYSNALKTDTLFKQYIFNNIYNDFILFDKETNYMLLIKKYFVEIDERNKKANNELYLANLNLENEKDDKLTEYEEDLYNSLLVYIDDYKKEHLNKCSLTEKMAYKIVKFGIRDKDGLYDISKRVYENEELCDDILKIVNKL